MSVTIISIVGARPQFIKAAAVCRAIAEHNRKFADGQIAHKIIHTGQHYDGFMSDVFFKQLQIPRPDYNLGVGNGSHGRQTGRMVEGIEPILTRESPACVIVYGDANSTLAGALSAAKLHIPLAHVEAGLRSFNHKMPEEVNRVLADHVSDILFCPTETAVEHLSKEGISEGVYLVGDVMYDCLHCYAQKAKAIGRRLLNRLDLKPRSYYLATIHRAENTDDPDNLRAIFEALKEISNAERPVVIPSHPRASQKISKGDAVPGEYVRIIPPVPYFEMIALEMNARTILTDSGGVQKEACWLKMPCITLRDESEWTETIDSGWNMLTGANRWRIVQAVKHIEGHRTPHNSSLRRNERSARQICRILWESFGDRQAHTTEKKSAPSQSVGIEK